MRAPVQHRPVAAALLVHGDAGAHSGVGAAGFFILSTWASISGIAVRENVVEGAASRRVGAAGDSVGIDEASRGRRLIGCNGARATPEELRRAGAVEPADGVCADPTVEARIWVAVIVADVSSVV